MKGEFQFLLATSATAVHGAGAQSGRGHPLQLSDSHRRSELPLPEFDRTVDAVHLQPTARRFAHRQADDAQRPQSPHPQRYGQSQRPDFRYRPLHHRS